MTRFFTKRSRAVVVAASLSTFAALAAVLVLAGSSSAAPPTTVNLATAADFAVLAGTGISDVPTSAITGNVGLSPHPGTDITGLTCAEVNGTIYTTNNAGPLCHNFNLGLVDTAKTDLSNAYNDAASRIVPPLNALGAGDKQLDGLTLAAGVYSFGHAATANLTTTLTLNGSASSVWIFQASSDLVFGNGSSVQMTGGASACNVFWQVTSSATIGSGSTVSGTILALTSITANSGSTINGRLLAQNGLVSLDSNTISQSACAGSGGSSSPPPSQPPSQPPGRALYCDAAGKTYDLVKGEDKLPPYDALNLVPAYVDPTTGSQSCNFPAVVTPATTTVTAPPPSPPTTTTTAVAAATTTTSTPKPPPAPKPRAGVKAAKPVRIAHVAPRPARHQGGFTG